MKKKRYKDAQWAGVLFLGIWLATMLLVTKVSGAAFPHTALVSTSPLWDSALVMIIQDGDTTRYTISQDTTFTLDDATLSSVILADFWDGYIGYFPDPAVVYQSSSATISTADKEEIAQLSLDSAVAHPEVYLGSVGAGFDTLLYTAFDTLNSVAGASVSVSARFIGGAFIGTQLSNSSGLTVWTPTAGDTLIFTALENGLYIWEVDTVVIPSGGGVDTLRGYGVTGVVTPTLPNTANVYLFIINNDGTPATGVGVSAFLMRGQVTDSAGNVYSNEPQYKKTDSLGVVYFTCVWSSYLIPETKWRFTGRAPGIGGFRKDYTVPRQAVDTLNLSE